VNNWLFRVGAATAGHRERRAQTFDRGAIRRRGGARLHRDPESLVDRAGSWHESRARGQRERIERVEQCSTEILVITCQACGREHERPSRCGCRLLCIRCRGAKARELRTRFLCARDSLIQDAASRGLLRPNRRGGRWGERLLTVTAPHFATDTLEHRIKRMFDAWRVYLRAFNQWLRARNLRSVEWLRVFEWTPGDDGLGHPHFHIWIFSPYIDRDLLVDWWAIALAKQDCASDSELVVDIRAASAPESIAYELIKYLTKDIDANGEKLAPELHAKVYCALDGHRSYGMRRPCYLYVSRHAPGTAGEVPYRDHS
jgi:hypothetical protein